MFCGNCGNKIIEGNKFCGNCGWKVPETIVVEVIHETPAINKCPSCGTELKIGASFCGNCGTKIGAVESVDKGNISVNKPPNNPEQPAPHSKDEVASGIVVNREVDTVYNGTVKRVVQFGVVVEILPGKEGLVPISKLTRQRVFRVPDTIKAGDTIPVKLLDIDKMGRLILSHIDAIAPDELKLSEIVVVEPKQKMPVENKCPSCGVELKTGASFCSNCGTKIVGEQSLNNEIVSANQSSYNPKQCDSCPEAGVTAETQNDYDRALELSIEAMKSNPKNAEAYYQRGLNRKKSEVENAIKDFTMAINLDSKNIVYYYERAAAYIDKSDNRHYNLAMFDVNTILQLDSGNGKAYYLRGLIFDELGQVDNAIIAYCKAIDFTPKYVPAYINRGFVYIKKKLYKSAILDFKKVLSMEPANQDAKYGLKTAKSLGN